MKNHQPSDVEQLVYRMLLEKTGTHFLDSGGDNNRHWQRNQGKTIEDFIKEPAVDFDLTGYKGDRTKELTEIEYTISVFHYLTGGGLYLDFLCEAFNALPVDDWEFDDAYGVSKQGGACLYSLYAGFGPSFNTFNHQSSLSQVIQGTYVQLSAGLYVLLQLHGGSDVRGGYTNARLFALHEGYMPSETVVGKVRSKDGVVAISNEYDGYSLTNENGAGIDVGPKDEVELALLSGPNF